MNDEDETPTPRAGSSRQASNSHGLHITLSPTIDSPQEATRHEIESFPPLSTSAADALRSAYFSASDSHSSAGLRRSLSNPDISGFLSTDLSHGSRLADVSETDTVENFSDLNRSRTQPRGKSRRKRKVDRTGSARIMSLGEEEVPQDWTVFGELFEDNHAPIVGKKSSQRGRTRSNTVANASETTNATVQGMQLRLFVTGDLSSLPPDHLEMMKNYRLPLTEELRHRGQSTYYLEGKR